MDYKNALRQAHITSLKQKYLDIIDEAKREKEQGDKEYFEQVQQAYLEREKKQKELPQRLRASGISGGASDEEENSVELEYGAELRRLEEKRRGYAEEYAQILDKQTRLMNTALNEYNARIALEDSSAAGKTASAKSTRSGSSKSGGSKGDEVSSENAVKPPIDPNDILNSAAISNVHKTFATPKIAENDAVKRYTPSRRYEVK